MWIRRWDLVFFANGLCKQPPILIAVVESFEFVHIKVAPLWVGGRVVERRTACEELHLDALIVHGRNARFALNVQWRCDEHEVPALFDELALEHVGAVYGAEYALIFGAAVERQIHFERVGAGVGKEWVFGGDLDIGAGFQHGLPAVDIEVCHVGGGYLWLDNLRNLSS